MTYREALDYLAEHCYATEYDYDYDDNTTIDYCPSGEEEAQLLHRLIEREEMHRWHDLRKDPEDKTTSTCLCVTYREPHTYKVEVLLPGCASIENSEKLLAWKYMEEFEDA